MFRRVSVRFIRHNDVQKKKKKKQANKKLNHTNIHSNTSSLVRSAMHSEQTPPALPLCLCLYSLTTHFRHFHLLL